MKYCSLFSIGVIIGVGAIASGQGLDLPRQSNTELIITEPPPTLADAYKLERIYPQIEIKNMISIEIPDDGTNRVYVADQDGRILTFPNVEDPAPEDVEVLLDIRSQVCRFLEMGFIGMAFDPNYLENGYVYVHYSKLDGNCGGFDAGSPSIVSRFTNLDPIQNYIDPATEEILITQHQDGIVHKGGQLKFGPDGMLYIGYGDGGKNGLRSQQLGTFMGKIIRIDVHAEPAPGLAYAIPADNPFLDREGATPELFATGLRNPYKFTFDSITNKLIACDVGGARVEEINYIQGGKNYGWPCREGFDVEPLEPYDQCDFVNGYENPGIAMYHSDNWIAVVGGDTYTSDRLPELHGVYLFADIFRGRVMSSRFDGNRFSDPEYLLEASNLTITTINKAPNGEILFGDYADTSGSGYYKTTGGGIYRLAPNTPQPSSFPLKLSDLPALYKAGSGIGHEVAGVYAYQPSSQLWSDGAHKERYFALPGMAGMGYRDEAGFDVPDGTITVKNFLLNLDETSETPLLQRIETRVLLKLDNRWYGASYEWNEEQTDATLLMTAKDRPFEIKQADGSTLDYRWHYPSRSECFQCHTQASNFSLGLQTPWLNSDFTFPQTGRRANQMESFRQLGLFNTPIPDVTENLPKAVDYYDESQAIEDRAKAYLAANCAMCHQPGGGVRADMDLRWSVPAHDMNVLNVRPSRGDLGLTDARLIYSGSIGKSVLHHRISTLDPGFRMPALASSRVDETGVALIEAWVQGLKEFPAQGFVGY